MILSFITAIPTIVRRSFVATQHIPSKRSFTVAPSQRVAMGLEPIALSPTVDVHIVPILSDNFSYLIHDKTARSAALVDPAEPKALLSLAQQLGATITTSLTTHHHWDHAGGNEQLADMMRTQHVDIDIIGSAYETAPAVTKRMESGDEHTIRSSSVVVRALRTPCHTNGHLCFHVLSTDTPAVFTGDTLFIAGCGRFFEGSADDMHSSLSSLAQLDDATLVFCGHEYTVTNLKFAASVDPTNVNVEQKLQWAIRRVEAGLPTVPSSIGDEKRINPFMRNNVDDVKKALGMEKADAVAVMKTLRETKNNFRP